MPITPEARVEHTAELGCAIAGIFDFLRLRGDGIVARLLDRNRTEPIPAEPSESARRCIGRSGDLREPSPERRMARDRSQGIGYRAPPKARRVTFDRPRASGDARTGTDVCSARSLSPNEKPTARA